MFHHPGNSPAQKLRASVPRLQGEVRQACETRQFVTGRMSKISSFFSLPLPQKQIGQILTRYAKNGGSRER
ncbi:hypothetical protein HK23_02310 [Acetobacter malorum]|nr:hypothetical protein HK23_02310 [Acetobacter malorum]